jgi:hypothetical protein
MAEINDNKIASSCQPSGPEHADQPLFDPAGDERLGDAVFAGGLGLGDPGWRFGGPHDGEVSDGVF